jgi:hypothetical protein
MRSVMAESGRSELHQRSSPYPADGSRETGRRNDRSYAVKLGAASKAAVASRHSGPTATSRRYDSYASRSGKVKSATASSRRSGLSATREAEISHWGEVRRHKVAMMVPTIALDEADPCPRVALEFRELARHQRVSNEAGDHLKPTIRGHTDGRNSERSVVETTPCPLQPAK